MNNKELIGELSRRLGYTNKDAARLLTSVTGIMGEELQEGKVIAIQDFGTFEVKKKMERITVNPVTKQRFLVPPKLILNFRPSNLWKERLKKTPIMSDKFTQQDLADLLAQRHEMNPADAEAFVRTLFALVEESVISDKYVKIKGLGTFKLIEVDARESIDINTGERIEIREHSRISFTPDSTMRETVNKPFSHFETVLLNENTHFDDLEETSELEDDTEGQEEETVETAFVEAEEASYSCLEGSTQTSPEVAVEAVAVEEKSDKQEDVSENVMQMPQNELPEIKEEPVRKNIFRLPWCMLATVLLAGVILGGIVVWSMFSGRRYIPESVVGILMEKQASGLKQDTIVRKPIQKDSAIQTQQIPHAKEDTVRESVAMSPTPEKTITPVVKRETLADTVEYAITGTKTTYTIRPGESLVRVAFKFYGNKKLWPYLVQHNKDIIKNADVVPVGTTIKIPELSPKADKK